MNKHLRFFLLLLCAILASSVPALPQTVVSGFVRNAETGAPLSEATVQVEDGFQAMVTNAEGRFELSVDRLPVTLKVSRIGYFSQNLLLNSPLPASVQIMLVPAIFDLDPVIVTDHESVEDIVRRMIENKNAWRARLKSLRAEAYSRFTLENDKDIVFMLEGLADAAWNPQNGWKATVKSFRRSSNNFVDDDLTNLRTLDRLAADALITNLYDDNILIGEHWLMGVTHPEALKSYRYEMEGQRLMDNRLIYDIRVTPKSRLFTGFTGRISVMDEDYAMVEAELKPSEAVIFPPPVREFSLTISQQFARFGAGFWLPVGLQMNAGLDVGIIGLMFPKMKGYLVSRLSNYQVIGIPDDKAAPGDTLSTRPILSPPPRQTVFAMNDSLLGDRMVPLTERERKAYATIDTTQTFIKAFEPKGVIAGVLKRQGVFDEKPEDREMARQLSLSGDRRSERPAGSNQPGRLALSSRLRAWHNRVDGGHIELSNQMRIRRTPYLIDGSLGYSAGSKQWSYGGGLTALWGAGNRHRLFVHYSRATEARFPSLYTFTLTSPSSLMGADDYFDYFLNERVRAGYARRFGRRQSWTATATLNLERHASLNKTTDFTLFNRDKIHRPNPAIRPGALRSISLSATAGRYPHAFDPENRRYLSLEAEWSPSQLPGNAYSFARYTLVYSRRFSTFLRRRMLPNTLDIRLRGGFSHGALPPERFGSLDGSLGPSAPMGVFRSLRGRPYEGERYAGLFWEHNFRTVPFELMGLRYLVRKGIGVSIYGAHGRTWISEKRLSALSYTPSYQNSFHHEVGLSITGLLYFFRLDFTRRLDAPAFFVSVGVGPGFIE